MIFLGECLSKWGGGGVDADNGLSWQFRAIDLLENPLFIYIHLYISFPSTSRKLQLGRTTPDMGEFRIIFPFFYYKYV